MSRERCPNCLEGAGVEISRAVTETGLKRTFECESCGNGWSVVF